MAKTSSIHIRVEPKVKEEVEKILDTLGMTSTEAINIYLRQIILNSGIPFEIKIPQFSNEMLEAIKEGYAKIRKQSNFKKEEFEKVIEMLSNNEVLPAKYHNHLLEPKGSRNMGMSCAT